MIENQQPTNVTLGNLEEWAEVIHDTKDSCSNSADRHRLGQVAMCIESYIEAAKRSPLCERTIQLVSDWLVVDADADVEQGITTFLTNTHDPEQFLTNVRNTAQQLLDEFYPDSDK